MLNSQNLAGMLFKNSMIFCFLLLSALNTVAQNAHQNDRIIVDKKGLIRWKSDNSEAYFFGVNYTVPFAYGYRSHKALGVDPEQAIRNDVYHFSRLGLNAFRVHVWDTEISDSAGNLISNEHLRLYDFLLSELAKKNIYTVVTPIAFWGNGYPEKDEKSPGFSSHFNKRQALVNDMAIRAQENYIRQFFQHVNPYTGKRYMDDPFVIAAEINNEPHHSGSPEGVTDYVSKMVTALKSTGWDKPIFYNISESPSYAAAVLRAPIDGVSFQWYPSGLVANRELKGNYLPHVSRYEIPFDTINAFATKARMVYEFDAGDILLPIMYPAMARSFRKAGFQWATQFAYDPMATAYANTEYQTHYLNLAYSPAKAISLMIAGEIFQDRKWSNTTNQSDTSFGDYTISYSLASCQMDGEGKYFYAHDAIRPPKNPESVKKIAGTGSSSQVEYDGTGAYFLDKMSDDKWRLELMPDALIVDDPFARPSLARTTSVIRYSYHRMKLNLPGITGEYYLIPLNEGNEHRAKSEGGVVLSYPGTYIISISPGADINDLPTSTKEFVAPRATEIKPLLVHEPPMALTEGKDYVLEAQLIGIDSPKNVVLEIQTYWGTLKEMLMKRRGGYNYIATIPGQVLVPGLHDYRILVQNSDSSYYSFPGGTKGDPYAWDNTNRARYHTKVVPVASPLNLFEAEKDRPLTIYNPDWRRATVGYGVNQRGEVIMELQLKDDSARIVGFQHYIGDKSKGRETELENFDTIYIEAAVKSNYPVELSMVLVQKDGSAFQHRIQLTPRNSRFSIPVSKFVAAPQLLLPRPYPGFQAMYYEQKIRKITSLLSVEKMQLYLVQPSKKKSQNAPSRVEISKVIVK